jgi:Ca2+-binding RTX toxin-like protein
VASFLDLKVNRELAQKIEDLFGEDVTNPSSSAYKFLNGSTTPDGQRIPNGIWDEISRRFAAEASGPVHVLISPDKSDGVFELAELPVLLDNDKVTTIEGIDREDLKRLYEQKDLRTVKNAIAAAAHVRIELSGLLNGNTTGYLDYTLDQVEAFYADPWTNPALADSLAVLGEPGRSNVFEGLSALRDIHVFNLAHSPSRTGDMLGRLALVYELLVVSREVSAAATPEDGWDTLKDWAIDAATSEVGALVAQQAARVALASFAVAGGPVSVALVFGAALAGGFFAPVWADALFEWFEDSDEDGQSDLARRLRKVYFGDATLVNDASLPALDGQFLRIGEDWSAASMAAAAEAHIAWRYALVEFNPFVVPEAPYAWLHNGDGRLDLHVVGSENGLTRRYLEARAQALEIHLDLDAAALSLRPGNVFPVEAGGAHVHFMDAGLHRPGDPGGAVIDLHYLSDHFTQLLFGGAGDDRLVGGLVADGLFGGDGDDWLDGGPGADYLEGGRGDDWYETDAGDLVFDQDGEGRIRFAGQLLAGGDRMRGETAYASPDGTLRYLLEADALRIEQRVDGGVLTVSGFTNGDLGIDLVEAAPMPALTGVTQLGSATGDVLYGEVDTAIVDYEAADAFNRPDGIRGLGGNDWIYAWDNRHQRLEGEVLVGSAPDTDWVEGGMGKDFIHGGAGDDRLYATTRDDAAAVEAGTGSIVFADPATRGGDFVTGQAGADLLYGSTGGDGLFGGDGDDVIHAGGGDDIIDGDWEVHVSTWQMDAVSFDYEWLGEDASGMPVLLLGDHRAGHGDDVIDAGDGNDIAWGGSGNDSLSGGAGDDNLSGDQTGRHADGSAILPGALHGDDWIAGGPGDDGLSGDGGADMLLGDDGDDFLDGDFRVVVDGDAAFHGNDWLDGGEGSDTLLGNGRDDVLLGGAGADFLFGDLDGLDLLFHGRDRLFGGDGDDQLVGQGNDDRLDGGAGDDRLYGDDIDFFVLVGNDHLAGGPGEDELSGGLGDDVLHGGPGDDRLWGDGGDDLLIGGGGADYLDGGDGADRYVLVPGDSPWTANGAEWINDIEGAGSHVVFSGDTGIDDIRVSVEPLADAIYIYYGTSDIVRIEGAIGGALDRMEFADGTVLDHAGLMAAFVPSSIMLVGGDDNDTVFGDGADNSLLGGDGNDRLYAGAGDDILAGGRGRDTLFGGPGADVYFIDSLPPGDPSWQSTEDLVDDADRSSTLRFGRGFDPLDMGYEATSYRADGTTWWNVTWMLPGRVIRYTVAEDPANLVDRFEFADGSTWSFADLQAVATVAEITHHGTDGVDTLVAGAGRDRLYGGIGNDVLEGGGGPDILDGGSGADVMRGGDQSDVYWVDDPGDVVVEAGGSGYDRLHTRVDIVLPGGIEHAVIEGADPVDVVGNAAANVIEGNYAANRLDGGDGDDAIRGGGGADTVVGGGGDDWLQSDYRIDAGPGNDRLVYGSGPQGDVPGYDFAGGPGDDVYLINQRLHTSSFGTITELPGEGVDTLVLYGDEYRMGWGDMPAGVENLRYVYTGDLWFGRNEMSLFGNDLDNRIEIGTPNPGARAWLAGGPGNDELFGSDIDTSDSLEWLDGNDGDDTLWGFGADDRLDGGYGDDVLIGGRGADQLFGGHGLDTYVFARGDSDASAPSVIDDADDSFVIRFDEDVSITDVEARIDGADLLLAYSPTDEIRILDAAVGSPMQTLLFHDGWRMALADLPRARPVNQAPAAVAQPSPLHLVNGRFAAMRSPADLFADQDGDPLAWRLALDHLGFLPDWLSYDPDDGLWRVDSTDFVPGDYGVEVLVDDGKGGRAGVSLPMTVTAVAEWHGTAAADVLAGSDADDNLYAGDGNDQVDGGPGSDWLWGDHGDDRLYGNAGDDMLHGGVGDDFLSGAEGADALRGGPGDDRYLLASASDTIEEQPLEGDDAVFASHASTLGPNLERLYLNGDAPVAGTGNELGNRIVGNSAANTLSGLAGDDTLFGRGGDDLLRGGAGNDVLKGGAGDDRYLFDAGDGSDDIRNAYGAVSATDHDTIELGDGIMPEQLWFSRDDDDLLLRLAGSDDRLRVHDWFVDDAARVDEVRVAAGDLILADDVERLAAEVAAFGVDPGARVELPPAQATLYADLVAAHWRGSGDMV